MLAVVPLSVWFGHLWVIAGLQSSQDRQGCFRNGVTNPMCQLFRGTLFLRVECFWNETRTSEAGFQRDP